MKINSSEGLIGKLYKKLVNRETITYIIAGGLTTAVNFISYIGLCKMGMHFLTANVWAWVIAVSFAYVVNKLGVFLAKSSGLLDEAISIIKFFAARLITLGVEQLGMFYFVKKLHFHNLAVKAFLAVFVIILNYVFSKLYIFKKNSHNEVEV